MLDVFAPLYKIFDGFLVNRADLIFANSQYSKRLIEKTYLKKNIQVTYPGASSMKDNINFDIRKKYKIDNDDFILITVGKLHPRKNISFLIQSLKKIIPLYPKIHLLIVGSGPEKDHLEKLVKELKLCKFVTLAGFVPDQRLYSFYRQSSLFVFSALREPFGIVVVEAMINGKAVLVPDEGGPAEICINGETGLVFKPNNSNDFVEKALLLINNKRLRAKLETGAKKRAKIFSWDRSYAELIKTINSTK